MFSGSIVALVTPFEHGDVNYTKFKDLVRYHLENETEGIVVAGTTGESPTLSIEEKSNLIKCAKDVVEEKIPVIAGTGTNNTKTTIELTKMAKETKANGALVVVPYYNKPSQEGIFLHFEAVAKSIDIPIILYNVPSRTGVNASPETIARLSRIKNIVAVKDSTGNLENASKVRGLCDIKILSGEDWLTYPLMTIGATGVIGVAPNIIPREMAKLCKNMQEGKFEQARRLHEYYFDLFKILFIESNPIPIKTAMKLMGMLNGELRLPLCPMSPKNEQKLREVLINLDLI
jgi:4-hydroxy-tetrahydrodipicolinate synthase